MDSCLNKICPTNHCYYGVHPECAPYVKVLGNSCQPTDADLSTFAGVKEALETLNAKEK